MRVADETISYCSQFRYGPAMSPAWLILIQCGTVLCSVNLRPDKETASAQLIVTLSKQPLRHFLSNASFPKSERWRFKTARLAHRRVHPFRLQLANGVG